MNSILDYEWKPILKSENERYFFPESVTQFMKNKYHVPAIYRWVIKQDQKIFQMYVGETDLLCPRRLNQYLKPGNLQVTNIRINESFQKFLNKKMNITLDYLHFSDFNLDGMIITMSNLNKKPVRRAIENLMILSHENSDISLMNK